jgi:hypothetical protein
LPINAFAQTLAGWLACFNCRFFAIPDLHVFIFIPEQQQQAMGLVVLIVKQ